MILEKSPPPFTILQWWVSRWKLRKHSERELKSAFIKLLLSLDFTFYLKFLKQSHINLVQAFPWGYEGYDWLLSKLFLCRVLVSIHPGYLRRYLSLQGKIVIEKDRFWKRSFWKRSFLKKIFFFKLKTKKSFLF